MPVLLKSLAIAAVLVPFVSPLVDKAIDGLADRMSQRFGGDQD